VEEEEVAATVVAREEEKHDMGRLGISLRTLEEVGVESDREVRRKHLVRNGEGEDVSFGRREQRRIRHVLRDRQLETRAGERGNGGGRRKRRRRRERR